MTVSMQVDEVELAIADYLQNFRGMDMEKHSIMNLHSCRGSNDRLTTIKFELVSNN